MTVTAIDSATNAPLSLLAYEALRRRKVLSTEEEQRYDQLKKGYYGERMFRELFSERDSGNVIALFNLLLEWIDAEFQIDALIIAKDDIYLIEVKNFTGDYRIEKRRIISLETNKEYIEPFYQLERSAYLLRLLLQSLRIDLEVRPYLVFINDSFMMYEANPRLPIIYRPQLERFLQKICVNAPPITSWHQSVADKLKELHKERSHYERLPKYEREELKSGVYCFSCATALKKNTVKTFICENCNDSYSNKEVLLHAAAEHSLLLPELNITTSSLLHWTHDVITRHSVRKILRKNIIFHLNGRYSYYTFPSFSSMCKLLTDNFFPEETNVLTKQKYNER